MLDTNLNLYNIRNILSMGKSIFDLQLTVTFYARVSTDKYEQEKSLKDQVEYFEDLIKNNPNWNYSQGYIDEGISGTSALKRDSFISMIKDAKLGKFNLILTKEISRFSRNTLDSIKYTQELLSYNIGVFFQTDNINTFLPDSELRLTIMASMAQEEVRKLSERVKFGFQRSINNGRVLGNDSIWGYKKDNCKLVVDEEEAVVVRLIYDLYVNEYIGMHSIAKRLTNMGYKSRDGNDFSATTVSGIIKNPKYKGYYCGNKTRVIDYRLKTKVNINKEEWITYKDEDNVPAIISEELWTKAQMVLKRRSSNSNQNKRVYQNRYPLSGKIKCIEHNTTLRRKVNTSSGIKKQKKINWVCSEYLKFGKERCSLTLLNEEELYNIINKNINILINDYEDVFENLINEYKNNIDQLDYNLELEKIGMKLGKCEQQKSSLLDLRIDQLISKEEFIEKTDLINKEQKELKIKLSDIEINIKEFILNEKKIKELKSKCLLKIKEKNYFEELIRVMVDKIEVSKTNDVNKVELKIYFNLGDIKQEYYFSKKNHFPIYHTYD